MAGIRAAAPAGMKIRLLFDQSAFVKNAIAAVLREGAIAVGLTALMILVFLGSWRSTLVVMVAIPLSLLTAIALLSALGETINIMTLGGLALSVGILVDNSTVAIENTHRLLEEGRDFDQAVIDGSAGIGLPTLISTLAICVVFVSVFFLEGAAKFLFTPLALAVVFAMAASYGLSRTLTPITIRALLRTESSGLGSGGFLSKFHVRFNAWFGRFRAYYGWVLTGVLSHRRATPLVVVALVAGAGALSLYIGRDFFPAVDSGLIQLHVRAPARTRIEYTAGLFEEVEDNIRAHIPSKDIGLVLDNIGLPQRVYNLAYTDGSTIGVNDGTIQIQLNDGHGPTAEYEDRLREELPAAFPGVQFYFQPADLVTQILNFGVPSQVDVQVQGRDRARNIEVAKDLTHRVAMLPGFVDAHLQQELDAPEMHYTIDRTRAQELGLNIQSVADNLDVSLSSSVQLLPNFWTDPRNGIPYYLAVQTPEYRLNNKDALDTTPVADTATKTSTIPDLLEAIAVGRRVPVESVFNHSNIQPVYDTYASVRNIDLGTASADLLKIVSSETRKLQPGNSIHVRGQIASMNSAFQDLTVGLLFAAVFVYLLMVINYQSFIDPLSVILALPGAGAGVVFLLFATGTTLSVPSLMGAIMAIGVASANSILLVTFAREESARGASAADAAFSAGMTRLRPVLMTAGAMIVGMTPLAIGGPGEEQNAVLARAVIGGVVFGTASTLLFVPYLYSVFGALGRRSSQAEFFNRDGGEVESD
jgi:multidrug efflux pump subunit AcrB